MDYTGLISIENKNTPHLGGNIDVGDPFTYSPNAWKYLIDRFCITSVLDLGSGVGNSAHWFSKQNINVIAVDGLQQNINAAVYPTICIDLTESSVNTKIDLVHCQEVVEHIEEQYVDNIIKSFQCGKYVCMTHAFPGQGGYHHVNEQLPQYWIDLMTNNGFTLLMEDTKRLRNEARKDNAIYLMSSGLVFHNKNN